VRGGQAHNARPPGQAAERLERAAAYQVFKLAHIARPVVRQQRGLRARIQPQTAQPQA